MAKTNNIDISRFPPEKIIRSREDLVQRNLDKGLTAYGYRRLKSDIKQVPVSEIYFLMFQGNSHTQIARKLNVSRAQLKQLMNSREFLESYQLFLLNASRMAEMFADYRDREAIRSFVELVGVRNRFINAEDVHKVKLAMTAAESLVDRSRLTQKTARQEQEVSEPLVITEEIANKMMEAIKESNRYGREHEKSRLTEGEGEKQERYLLRVQQDEAHRQ